MDALFHETFQVCSGFKVSGKISFSNSSGGTGGTPCARKHHRCGGSCGRAACLLLGSVSSCSHLYTALLWAMIKITKGFAQISAQSQSHRAWRVHATLHLQLPCSCSAWLGLMCWRAQETPWERKPILDSLALGC